MYQQRDYGQDDRGRYDDYRGQQRHDDDRRPPPGGYSGQGRAPDRGYESDRHGQGRYQDSYEQGRYDDGRGQQRHEDRPPQGGYSDQGRLPDRDRRRDSPPGSRDQRRDDRDGLRTPAGKFGKTAQEALEKLRAACKKRGVHGIKSMGRTFRIYDDDRDKKLTKEEFKEGLQDYGVSVSQEEIRALFNAMDLDGSGMLNFDEFMYHLRPPMSEKRVQLIEQAFKKLDVTKNGDITFDDLKDKYDVRQHPKYKSGEMTKQQILTEFLHSFEGGPHAGNRDGKVTWKEFLDYYSGVSASIDKDVYFDYMMRQSWKL